MHLHVIERVFSEECEKERGTDSQSLIVYLGLPPLAVEASREDKVDETVVSGEWSEGDICGPVHASLETESPGSL